MTELIVRRNPSTVEGCCPICGERNSPSIPYDIYVDGSKGTDDPVCFRCALKTDPLLIMAVCAMEFWFQEEEALTEMKAYMERYAPGISWNQIRAWVAATERDQPSEQDGAPSDVDEIPF